jgi:hypothetical protein
MFQASSRPSSGAQQLQLQPLVLPLEHDGSSAVGRGQASPTMTNGTATTARRTIKFKQRVLERQDMFHDRFVVNLSLVARARIA